MILLKAHKDLTLSCGCKIKEGEPLVMFLADMTCLCPDHAVVFVYKKIKDLQEFIKEVKNVSQMEINK